MPSKWDHVFTESIWMAQAKGQTTPLYRRETPIPHYKDLFGMDIVSYPLQRFKALYKNISFVFF